MKANWCEINEKGLNFSALWGSSTPLAAADSIILSHMELYRHALRSQRNDTLHRGRNKGADVDANRSFVRWLFRSAKCVSRYAKRGDTPIGNNNVVALLMPRFYRLPFYATCVYVRYRTCCAVQFPSNWECSRIRRKMSPAEMIFHTRYLRNPSFNFDLDNENLKVKVLISLFFSFFFFLYFSANFSRIYFKAAIKMMEK